jgi:hypothetical protein
MGLLNMCGIQANIKAERECCSLFQLPLWRLDRVRAGEEEAVFISNANSVPENKPSAEF